MNEINELAEFIYDAGIALDGVDFAYKSDHFERLATALINAGYRKQSETVKEFAEKLKGKLTDPSGWVLYKCQDLCYDIDKVAAEYGKED